MRDIQLDLSCPLCDWEWHRSSLPREEGTPTNLGLAMIAALTAHHAQAHDRSMVLTLWAGIRFLGPRQPQEDAP